MVDDRGDVLPDQGTVLRRKLFQEFTNENLSRTSLPLHAISPRGSRPESPEKVSLESAPINDMHPFECMFEHSGHHQSTAIHAPKPIQLHQSPINPSLTAAVLATQLSPPNSSASSRRSSPTRPEPSPPTQRSTVNKSIVEDNQVKNSSNDVARKPIPPPIKKKPSTMSSLGSLGSKASSVDIWSNALAAATIAHNNNTSPQPPKQLALQPAIHSAFRPAHQSTPPKPPPPRVTRRLVSANTESLGFGTSKTTLSMIDSGKSPTLPARSSIRSLTSVHTINFDPPPLPKRTVVPAKSAAVLSHANASTSSLPITLPQNQTKESTIAASLAPSRTITPGPRKPITAPLPPPSHHKPQLQRLKSAPSPPKNVLKPTMRPERPRSRSPSPPKPPRSLIRPSNNNEELKHRWRHVMSEKERKRYEGLWAANRGLLLPLNMSDAVVNDVVADIWKRSRLGNRVLADIWSLVDRGLKGWLSREEFVVGTWLCDQALRGKKTPVKVDESVWDSVRPLWVVLPSQAPQPPPPRRGRMCTPVYLDWVMLAQ